ncbi:GNAT family N-acetyltransferase [Streptomyces sp. E11-3]|uniref:GNAT family N-acetyltransferase n=1 Tax=Streptomyces sp. E11-3 TaxID=3110112 RepID=UPI00397F285C
MTRPSYEVRVAGSPADREACFTVRKAVFVVEQRVPEDLEYDAYDSDESTAHVLAVGQDGPLGAGRLLVGPEGYGPETGKLGRLAVLESARGLGVGIALVRAIETEAARRGCAEVVLYAQTSALGFYERLGYEAYGPEFTDAGIPHRAMHRAL